MKTCLREETQQDEGLIQFPIMLVSDGFHHVIKPQDWKVFSVRGKDDGRRKKGEQEFLD
jgi:hypothetical protein